MKLGLQQDVRQQRHLLFESNVIDIKGKSTLSLLKDEVCKVFLLLAYVLIMLSLKIIHPFYVFQLASIVLWSIDDYYYYAFCIALISIMSITTTLVDTKKVSYLVASIVSPACFHLCGL